ncbi:hypothetical protein L3Q82_020703, partial [Scortum barcoo]
MLMCTSISLQAFHPLLRGLPHQIVLQRNFHVTRGSKDPHMKDLLYAQICAPGPYSSDVPHSATLCYFDVHIVTKSYGTLNVPVECLSEPQREQKGGGWVLWVQQQSGPLNPCSLDTGPSQNSGGPPSFSYFANLSTANLLLTSSSPPLLLSASMAALPAPSQQSHCLSVGDIT